MVKLYKKSAQAKVNLCLFLTKYHATVEVWLHAFLTWALDVGEWSTSYPGHLTPMVRVTSTHSLCVL